MTDSEPLSPAQPESPDSPNMTEKERATLYVEMWKQTITVQQHFNDIEWRIRGLALTAATFSVGAAGLAVNNGHPLPGAVILVVGLVLWYAFYFVDRYWYHPLLIASVMQGHKVETKIEECGLPDAALTKAISAGSPINRPKLIRAFTKKANKNEKLRSEGKLVWFYRIGFIGLAGATIILSLIGLLNTFIGDSTDAPPTIVKIENRDELREHPGPDRPTPRDELDRSPTPSEAPTPTHSPSVATPSP